MGYLRILMLIEFILIGVFSFLEWGLLTIITTIALLLTFNLQRIRDDK